MPLTPAPFSVRRSGLENWLTKFRAAMIWKSIKRNSKSRRANSGRKREKDGSGASSSWRAGLPTLPETWRGGGAGGGGEGEEKRGGGGGVGKSLWGDVQKTPPKCAPWKEPLVDRYFGSAV